MTDLMPLLPIPSFFVAWIYQEWKRTEERTLWNNERERLLDRLMAKNLPELNYEVRKAAVLKQPKAPSPFPDDAALAQWERDHATQVQTINAEAEARIHAMKRDAVKETSHGS